MKRSVWTLLLVAVVITVAVGCNKRGAESGEEALLTEQVKALFDQYEQGMVTGDPDQIAACFATSFELVLSIGSYQATRDMCRQAWNETFSVVVYPRYDFTKLQITSKGIDEIEVISTIAVKAIAKATGKTEEATLLGRWILKRHDGRWLIVREEQPQIV